MKEEDVKLNDELQKSIAAIRKRVQEDMLAILAGRPLEGYDDDDDPAEVLREEITRLERRFLEETKAHDKTRHRLECRERELERIRSNMYKQRVEETQEKKGGSGHCLKGGGFVNDFDPLATGARIMVKKLADDLDKSVLERLTDDYDLLMLTPEKENKS